MRGYCVHWPGKGRGKGVRSPKKYEKRIEKYARIGYPFHGR
jgi:hypothetical protein